MVVYVVLIWFVVFFFFKQKTAYEMRISDWSSDVCSSDLAEDFESIPGHGALATLDGQRVVVGNRRLMEREGIELNQLADRRQELAEGGRTAVLVAIDGRAAGLVGMADAPRPTAADAVAELRRLSSDERPVGNECVSKCRSRWSPLHPKKQ